MRTAFRQIGTVLLVIVGIAALLGGCALYQRGKDMLPGPAQALLSSFDSAGPMGLGPADVLVADNGADRSPLEACPDYAGDVAALGRAIQGDLTAEQTAGNEIAALLAVQVDQLEAGGTPDAPSATGVDLALVRQNQLLAGAADRVRAAPFSTPQVRALSSSFAAALDAVVAANRAFLDGGTGTRTRSAWMNWATRAQGPYQQIEVISSALSKCPG